MKLDFTPIYLAFGIGLAAYLILRLRKVVPDVRFVDVRYDKAGNELELVVENVSDKTVYVKPALRLVRLTPASEWRERTARSDSPVPMMTAAAGSVIKGYELIGEYAEPVPVEAGDKAVIKYPVMRDFGLMAYDNIKVDSPVGENPLKMEGSATGTVRLNLSELLKDDKGIIDAINEYLEIAEAEDAALNAGGEMLDRGGNSPALDVRKSGYPLQARCFCCGNDRWLNWVVEGNHVCDECREFLAGEPEDPCIEVDGCVMDDKECQEVGVELVEQPRVDLKPRHRQILDALDSENTMSTKELASTLDRGYKAVGSDLRYLLKNNLVDRVKIKGNYKYFSLSDDDQIILFDPNEPDLESTQWT